MLDNLIRPAPEHILKVTELTRRIKAQLEGGFAQLWVRGEISNLRRQSSGHVYFSLKDAGSQLPCVLFARDAAQQSFELCDGMEVILMGGLSVYAPHGRYQLIAKVAIQSGLGKLQLEFERLKRKLADEGLFNKELKRPLPILPMRIAVVTSPSGAAVRDFLRILRRRGYTGEVIIFPAKVQGQGAAEEIAAMLEYAGASKDFDLVVLTRGGGSIEDLWAFNEELLARAVAACPLPVISAVGHEIDVVLSDYVADQRAETPSGAAELISSLYLKTLQRLDTARDELLYWTQTGVSARKQNLRAVMAQMQIIAPERVVEHLGMRLDDLENRLSRSLNERLVREKETLAQHSHRLNAHHPRLKIGLAHQSLDDISRRLGRATKVDTHAKHKRLADLEKRLENGSLAATLRRGYAVMKNPEGAIISTVQAAHAETLLTARFHDGKVTLKVQKD
jgi:exodeoxyribonuclease VII large subunit